MSLTRISLLFAAFVAVLFAVRGEGEPAAAKKLQAKSFDVKIEFNDGRTRDAKCVTQVFRIEADYGVIDLLLDKVKVIDFVTTDGRLEAMIELIDKTHLSGHAVTTELLLEGITEPVTVAEIREFKVVRNVDSSLFAIIFGLVTLTIMEIVLGIDNIIFLAIVAGRLPPEQQPQARKIGLAAALGTRSGCCSRCRGCSG